MLWFRDKDQPIQDQAELSKSIIIFLSITLQKAIKYAEELLYHHATY